MFKKIIKISLLMLAIGGAASASPYSQDSKPKHDCGIKYLRHFSRKDYKNQPQNWSIIQDKRGIIYMANQGGLMEFDGVSWNEIPIPNKTARSLALDDNGTLYVGGLNEIGCLSADAKGRLDFVSLTRHLEEKYKNFSYVWRTLNTQDGIYYCTTKFLFLWNNKEFKTWTAGNAFATPFLCRGTLYFRQPGLGLFKMNRGEPQLLPHGEAFADKKIFMLTPYEPGKILIGTRSTGLYFYDEAKGEVTPFGGPGPDYINKKDLSGGIRLSDGDFALATLRGGLVIMDPQGNVKHLFDKAAGLPDDTVNDVFEDLQGNLWLALNEGATKIEYASPFTLYNEQTNLPGLVLAVTRHPNEPGGNLYVGTTNGLFGLAEPGNFQPVPGMTTECWSLLSTPNGLLAATTAGVFQVFQVDNNQTRMVIQGHAYVLHPAVTGANRVWVGKANGLASLSPGPQPGQWTVEYQWEKIPQAVTSIAEDLNGNLWLGLLTNGVLKIRFPPGGITMDPAATQYDSGQGLPLSQVRVFHGTGNTMLATEKGIFRWDEKSGGFIPDAVFGDEFAGGENARSVSQILEDSNKIIWFHSRGKNFRAEPQAGGTFFIDPKPFLRVPLAIVNAIYPEPGGKAIWFAGMDGLIRYDTAKKKKAAPGFSAFIRKVWLDGEPVYCGYEDGIPYKRGTGPASPIPVFPYKNRNLRFEFAAPFFEAETETTFRCLLEGYDHRWTTWSKETWKDYTNLEPGVNVFRVCAQNVYGDMSREAVFSFRILPPWYRTWWAYALYTFAAFLLVFFIVRWRSYRLVREKEKLEQIIKAGTKEIAEKNRQLEEQAQQLKEMDKVKSRFFANISHEFRTPLTLILGPLEQMLGTPQEKESEQKKKMRLMLRNSQRLLGLINQLLMLSKFDSGTVRLQVTRQNIVPFLKGILHSFDSLAVQGEVELIFQAQAEEILLYFDKDKFEEVMSNLLSNAVKFTPAGGRITLAVKVDKAASGTGAQGAPEFVEVSVTDTGPGIPQEELGHIFERFYQADSTYAYHRQGTGIGLAIAKEIVELHHGVITAHSPGVEGAGTRFVIQLPLPHGMGDLRRSFGPSLDALVGAPGLPVISSDITKETCLIEAPDSPDSSDRSHPSSFSIQHSTTRPLVAEGIESTVPGKADIPAPGLEGYREEEAEVRPGEIEEASGEAIKAIDKEIDLEPIPQEKEIILVVEDSAGVREYIRGALEAHYTVKEAKDGEEGLRQAREIIPDLIICDIMMPGMDGYEVCRALKNDIATSHIPIILLTARASEESILEGLESGADDYITKPFSTRILCARIRNLIELRRQLHQTWNREMTLQPTRIAESAVDKKFIKELKQVMAENMTDTDFNVDQLSRKLDLSHTTLYRKIHALTGETPNDFIRSYRLKRGAELLRKGISVLEVALEVGFSSAGYFSKCFKKKFNRLPTEYQATESE